MVMMTYYNILSGCPLVSNRNLTYQEALIGSNFVKNQPENNNFIVSIYCVFDIYT